MHCSIKNSAKPGVRKSASTPLKRSFKRVSAPQVSTIRKRSEQNVRAAEATVKTKTELPAQRGDSAM
jgi:hypothetical protein